MKGKEDDGKAKGRNNKNIKSLNQRERDTLVHSISDEAI